MFYPPAVLKARYAQLGAGDRPVICYRGSGVQACHLALGMAVSGIAGARIYVGSWSDWSRHDDAPAQRG